MLPIELRVSQIVFCRQATLVVLRVQLLCYFLQHIEIFIGSRQFVLLVIQGDRLPAENCTVLASVTALMSLSSSSNDTDVQAFRALIPRRAQRLNFVAAMAAKSELFIPSISFIKPGRMFPAKIQEW
jgi:hypothetical protein